MLTLRTAGVVLLAVFGYGLGAWLLHWQLCRVRCLQQLEQLLGRIQDEIEYRALPLDEILYVLQQEDGFDCLDLKSCNTLHQLSLPPELLLNQRQLIQQALATLGQRTSQESCRQLEYYQKQCARFVSQERERLSSAQRLYRQLGVCGGLLAALVLL